MAKELTELEKHYNKFNEEKRLGRRHGQVEYRITMAYIHRYLKEMEQPKILDVGAGTGRYSVALANEGYDVTAVERDFKIQGQQREGISGKRIEAVSVCR